MLAAKPKTLSDIIKDTKSGKPAKSEEQAKQISAQLKRRRSQCDDDYISRISDVQPRSQRSAKASLRSARSENLS